MEQTTNLEPILNIDVLINIMSMSGPRTISRLMRASRELYPAGPKYLLRRIVRLRDEANVSSFVAFMQVDSPKRVPLLKSLEISTGRLPGAEADALEKLFLDCAPLFELQRLTVDRAEEFFESSPGLQGVFSMLHSVKHLTVSEIGSRANTFLVNFRSRLVSANLFMVPHPPDDDSLASDDSDEDEDDEEDDGDFRNPIVQLHASQDTLETLSVRYCDTFSDLGLDHVYEQTYPHVHALTLTANELPATGHYARAFPAVRTLTLECDARELDAFGADFEDFCALRMMNTDQLSRARAGAWAGIEEVHGTLIDHFLLGLRGPVERVHVTGGYMDKRMWRLVLLACKPAYVNFQGFDVDLFFGGGFKRLMRGNLLEPVRCFEIMVFFGGMIEPENVDAPEALNALIDGIAEMSSLRSFGVTLCCYGLQPSLEDMMAKLGGNPAGKPCAAEEYLRELDLHAFALEIQKRMPRLESIAVSLIGHRARPAAFATLGADVEYEKGAVERIPLRHGSRITMFDELDPAKILRNMPFL